MSCCYVDARAGCAGDMFLGALVDAGLPIEVLRDVVQALGLDAVTVSAERVRRGPLASTKVHVLVDDAPIVPDPGLAVVEPAHAHRRLGEILDVVRSAEGLAAEAKADAVRVFELLAEAEARVHGHAPEEVAFHEVGSADALVDVVGTCVGLRYLGVSEVHVAPLPWSVGEIQTAHGRLSLPAPAVVHLLEGHPTFAGAAFEQVTPTGAALVRALSRGTSLPAGFTPRAVGVGAGSHPGMGLPNVVRIVLGEIAKESERADAVLLETNLDDATGQEVARAIERALEDGALDAWATSITMKKGRPGLVVSLLVSPEDVARFENILFAETPTLGVRRRSVARTVLSRQHVMVETPYGPVRMKVRETPEGLAATPEHDDCLRLAKQASVSLRRVRDAAQSAWSPHA